MAVASGTDDDFETILGVRFLNAPVEDAVARIQTGGLMVVPSAPALTLLTSSPAYRAAVTKSDFAIVDSAYLALLWFVVARQRLHRVSGLKFLRAFLTDISVHDRDAIFLIDPTAKDAALNQRLLQSLGFKLSSEASSYVAPQYNVAAIDDPQLLAILEKQRPRYILVNLGGGVQEPLGLYLKENLSFLPAIICTGAAIAFLTGEQARIPPWADSLGLGWLLRSFQDPKRFVRRYAHSVRLAKALVRYRRGLPPLVPDPSCAA